MTRTDVQLMLDVKAGDEASFDFCCRSIARRWSISSIAWCGTRRRRRTWRRKFFCGSIARAKQYSPSAKFTTWLFRIATNLALNSVRDNRYRRMEISIDAPADEDEAPIQVPTREMRIDEHMIERDRAEIIRRAIQSLPEKQRAAVLLHKYEEMDYGEIAKILECSESALKSLLFRAYETLRVQLAPLVAAAGGESRGGRKAHDEVRGCFKRTDCVSGPPGEFGRAVRGGGASRELRGLPDARRGVPQGVERAGRDARSIEPSLGFDARVRQRVAAEPRRAGLDGLCRSRGWRFRWRCWWR